MLKAIFWSFVHCLAVAFWAIVLGNALWELFTTGNLTRAASPAKVYDASFVVSFLAIVAVSILSAGRAFFLSEIKEFQK